MSYVGIGNIKVLYIIHIRRIVIPHENFVAILCTKNTLGHNRKHISFFFFNFFIYFFLLVGG